MSPEPKTAHSDEESKSSGSKRSRSSDVDPGKVREEALKAGVFGETPGPDREEYALTTGPDSPSAAEGLLAAAEADLEARRASMTEGEG
jgi:hypothetical protein